MNTNTRLELEALITEREGMKARNKAWCGYAGDAPYKEDDFKKLADKIRAVAEPEEVGIHKKEVPAEQMNTDRITVPQTLQCSICNMPSTEGKQFGDICGRDKGATAENKHCLGILGKG